MSQRLYDASWREAAIAALVSTVVVVALSWPLPAHMRTRVAQDLGDPLLSAWELSWDGHALKTHPSDVFQSNILQPHPDSLAFTDSLIGLSPLGLAGNGVAAEILRYNLAWLLSFVVAATAMFLLVRELGLGRIAAAFAAASYTYAPFKLAHGGHLNLLWNGGLPLAAFLAIRGYRAQKPWIVLAAWIVAAWQVTLGWNLGLPFAYLIGLACAVAVLSRGVRRRLRGGVLVASIAGVALFALTSVAMARPYLRVADREPAARRGLGTLGLYSPPLSGLIAAPKQDLVWGAVTGPLRDDFHSPVEQAIFPGLIVLVLAGAGAAFGRWPRKARAMIACGSIAFVAFALGAHPRGLGRVYPYRLLWQWLPGFRGLRAPGRLVTFAGIGLAVLAALAVQRIATKRAWAGLLLVAGVLVEGAAAPVPTAVVPLPPANLDRVVTQPGLQLHLPIRSSAAGAGLYQLWTVGRFPPLANGDTGFIPPDARALFDAARTFPDVASVTALRRYGVRVVIVHAELLPADAARAFARVPLDGLPVTRTIDGPLITFTLS